MLTSILKKAAGLGSAMMVAIAIMSCSGGSESHRHTFEEGWSYDSETHWQDSTCEHKDLKKNQSAHTWNHEDYQYDAESGKEYRICTECNYIDDKDHIHETASALSKNETNHWKVCDVCKEMYEIIGHRLGEWQEVTAATEEADGLEMRICFDCGYEDERVIVRLNHTHRFDSLWTAGVSTHWHAAICDHDAKNEETEHSTTSALEKDKLNHWKVCDVCGGYYEVTSHIADEGIVTKSPSCTEKGIRTYKCSVCEEVFLTEEIAALGHTEDSGTIITAPTCVTKGVKEYQCSACEKVVTVEIPELYSSPVDATTGLAANSSSKFIYFGVFPKRVLSSASGITVDETVSVKMGANTYYKGSDGYYYAKVKENAYVTNANNHYIDGTIAKESSAESYRYFKVEPIKWKVLTLDYNNTGKALLLAENILTGNVPYYVSKSSRTINKYAITANNYKFSTIRAYLNGKYESNDTQSKTAYVDKGFLQTAFTGAAQSLICDTVVDNSKETTGISETTYASKYACLNTKDKIFLLSTKEAINSDYGFAAGGSNGTGNARIRTTTDYAKANYAYQSTSSGYGGDWWLRSPFYYNYYLACYAYYDGTATKGRNVTDKFFGVVPALTIELQ